MKAMLKHMFIPGRKLVPHIILIFLWLDMSGCRSAKQSGSSGFASVVLSGNTPGQIGDAAVAVFQQNGYKARQTDPGSLVFEKQGSRMNNFAYGNWLGDTPVWIRVKGNVLPVGQMTYRLECTAYLVRDIGTGAEEELPVNGLHRAPYQKLLDEVALRLGRK